MKRSFSPPARHALGALVASTLLCGAACEPDNNVKPGAPVLMELTMVTPGPSPVTITETTPECATGLAGGETCNPMMDGLCRQTETSWCSCAGTDPNDPTAGMWDCTPFPVLAVVAVFDRLLDTAPFDVTYPAGIADGMTATAAATATPPTFTVVTDYASSGTPMGITPLFAQLFSGNFRDHGPSAFGMPDPGFPSSSTVTVTLHPDQLRAKDGTPFTASGLLQSGMVGFTMPAFSASVVGPDNFHPDPRVIFTNYVHDQKNAMGEDDPDYVGKHITVTANGADITAMVTISVAPAIVTVSPPMGGWPTGATIVITVDATTKNTLGQTIDAAQTGMFTAP